MTNELLTTQQLHVLSRIILICGIVFFSAGPASADDSSYHPRNDLISDALDRAETTYSKTRSVPSPSPAQPLMASKTAETPVVQTAAKEATAQPVIEPVNPPADQPAAAKPVVKTEAAPSESIKPDVGKVAPPTAPVPDKDSLAYRYFSSENPQNQVEVGTEAFDYSYREEGLMKLDGMMYGVFMEYQHRYHDNQVAHSWKDILASEGGINLLKFDMRLAGGGEIKYRSEGTGIHEGEDHYAFETRLMAGYEIPWKRPEVVITPYAGLGYRYLLDDNGGTQTTTGHWGYDRESNYYYVPIGLELTRFYQRGWSLRTRLEYDWFLSGKQYSHHEDVPGSTDGTLCFNQPKGYGLRGSLRVAKEGEHLEFFVEPFVRYWHIRDSDVDSGYYEPNNRTEEYGARMGIRF